MSELPPAFPSTYELLTRIQPNKKTIFATKNTDRYAFGAGALLIFLIFIFIAAGKIGWMTMQLAKYWAISLYGALILIYLSYTTLQLIAIFKQLKSGFKQAVKTTEDRIAHEEKIIKELAIYPHDLVREKSKLLDLDAKRWMRRSGMGAAFSAASAAGINLLGAVITNSSMKAISHIPSTAVYALMFGLLLGSALVFSFAAKLENVAGILSIAADRK